MTIEEFEKFVGKKLTIYCPIVKVLDAKDNEICKLSGEIYQDKTGHLFLKFITDNINIPSLLFNAAEYKVGKLSKPCYKIEAYPCSGGLPWKAETSCFDVYSGENGSFIKAKLYELRRDEKIPDEVGVPDSIEIILNAVNEFPLMITQEYKKKVLGREVISIGACRSELHVDNLSIIFIKDGDVLNANIISSSSQPYALDDSVSKIILSAVQIVTGRRINILIEKLTKNKKSTTTLHSSFSEYTNSIKVPIDQDVNMGGACLNFLKLYVEYLLKTRQNCPELLLIVNSVVESAGSSIEAQILTLSVAVESLINKVISKKVTVTKTITKDEIKKIKKAALSCLDSDSKKDKVGNLINILNQIRAKDLLYKLVSDNILSQSLVDSWDKIRNTSAHGSLIIDETNIQEYFDHLNNTLTLFYQLIFLVVGYKGKYTDYSGRNYLTKSFEKELAGVKYD